MISGEIKNWIKLLNIPNVGPKTFHLIRRGLGSKKKSISDLFRMDKQELYMAIKQSNIRRNDKVVQSIWEIRKSSDESEKEFQQLTNRGVEIIVYTDDNYPKKLRRKLNNNAPPILYVFGNKTLLNIKSIAVVGKRNASEEATYIADLITKKMVSKGYNIISGYAKGIDTVAHISALKYGGTTIIILPFGIFEFAWKKQFREIENFNQNTLVISQFHPESKWKVSLAMQRNSLIIGLSEAIFAIELNKSGGTYSEIKKSLEIGVPTFVLDTEKNREIFIDFPKKPIFIKNIEDLNNQF